MKAVNRALARHASFGPFIIRVVLGGLFVLHGIDKFRGGLAGVEEMFASNGVPAAAVAAPLAAVLEIVVGLALILGLFTRIAAAVLALFLAGAIFWVKADVGILGGAEVDLAYIAGLVALVVLGPGKFSVDEVVIDEETVLDLRAPSQPSPRTPVSVG